MEVLRPGSETDFFVLISPGLDLGAHPPKLSDCEHEAVAISEKKAQFTSARCSSHKICEAQEACYAVETGWRGPIISRSRP